MSDDTISRQDTVDVIASMIAYHKTLDDAYWYVKEDAPPAQPQPQWIPVTERLPEQTGKYLVSVKNGNVYAGTYDSYGRQFQCAAVAWMPLPEPYEE